MTSPPSSPRASSSRTERSARSRAWTSRSPTGTVLGRARPQRGRQDHGGPHPRHPPAARRGTRRRSPDTTSSASPMPSARRSGSPASTPRWTRTSPDARTSSWSGACSTSGGRRAALAPTSCSPRSISPTPAGDRRAPTPAACAAGSTSRPLSSGDRPSCSSTSRRPASIPASRIAPVGGRRELRRDGTTLLLTTQYLEEADRLADRIAVIDGGRVIAEGTSTELKDRLGEDVVDLRVADTVPDRRRARPAARPCRDRAARRESAGRISLPVHHGAGVLAEVVRRIDGAGHRGRRAVAASAQSRRRVPRPHRPQHRGRRRSGARPVAPPFRAPRRHPGGRRMSAAVATRPPARRPSAGRRPGSSRTRSASRGGTCSRSSATRSCSSSTR